MANHLKSIASTTIASQGQDAFKDCGKHISQYRYTKLPMGDESSHLEFVPVKYQQQRTRGPRQKSQEQKNAEAAQMLAKGEEKAMKLNDFIEPTDF